MYLLKPGLIAKSIVKLSTRKEQIVCLQVDQFQLYFARQFLGVKRFKLFVEAESGKVFQSGPVWSPWRQDDRFMHRTCAVQ